MIKISIIEDILSGRLSEEEAVPHLDEESRETQERFDRFMDWLGETVSWQECFDKTNDIMDWVYLQRKQSFRNGVRFGFFLALELVEGWK
ncbi:MAG: hypothetical protein IJY62_04495 [Clostridia bacterium]|nr:hypothetical protein [Clostridia bacterium]